MYSKWSLSLAVFMVVCSLWGCESKDYCAYSSCEFEEMSAPDADMRVGVECVSGDECPSLANAQASCSAAGECVYTCDERWAVGPGGDLKREGCTCDKTMSSCQSDAVCGDGFKEGEEQCDQGQNNSDTEPDACRSSCKQAACGDKVVDAGEVCDDGDDDNTDDCTQGCSRCGNGKIDEGETCDDGQYPPVSGDGCSATCQTEPYWYCEPGKGCELHLYVGSDISSGGLDFSASKLGVFVGARKLIMEEEVGVLGQFEFLNDSFMYKDIYSVPKTTFGFSVSAFDKYVAVGDPSKVVGGYSNSGSVFVVEVGTTPLVVSEVERPNSIGNPSFNDVFWGANVVFKDGLIFVSGMNSMLSVLRFVDDAWRVAHQDYNTEYKGFSSSFFDSLGWFVTGFMNIKEFGAEMAEDRFYFYRLCQDGEQWRLFCSNPMFRLAYEPFFESDSNPLDSSYDVGGDVWADDKYVYVSGFKGCEAYAGYDAIGNGCIYIYGRFDGVFKGRVDNVDGGQSFARQNSYASSLKRVDTLVRFNQVISFGDYLAVADTEASVNGLPKVGRVVVFKNTGDWKSYEHRVIEPKFAQANMNFGYNLAVHDGVLWIGASDARLTYVDPVTSPRGFITKADLAKLFETPAP